MLIKLFSKIFFVFFDFDFYGLTWHHKCVWSWIWFPRQYELHFFSSALMSFSPFRVQCMGVLRAFRAMLIFLHGHLYCCRQVTINSINGLDMVSKKGLWWSTRVRLSDNQYGFRTISENFEVLVPIEKDFRTNCVVISEYLSKKANISIQ